MEKKFTEILTEQAASKQEERGNRCSICFGSYKVEEKFTTLPGCNHQYHYNCIETWLLKSHKCPICRTIVRKRLIEYYHGEFELPQTTTDNTIDNNSNINNSENQSTRADLDQSEQNADVENLPDISFNLQIDGSERRDLHENLEV